MVRFVWLDVPAGGRVPVNPDQVAYLRQHEGRTLVVFGAVAGGLHELAVAGDGDAVARRLEEDVSGSDGHLGPVGAPKGKRHTPKAPSASPRRRASAV